MLIVPPDVERRIDLPGAGPCPRPIEIDGHRMPLTQLVSLRVYSFAQGVAIDGEAEGDEVFIVLMRGVARIAITQDGVAAGRFALGSDAGDRAVYMPPHASYRLEAVEACDIAYARCAPRGDVPVPRGFAPDGDGLSVPDHARGMMLALALLPIDGSLALGDETVERFVHVRGAGVAQVGDATLGDWHAAILPAGEAAVATALHAPVEILTIGAAAT